MVAVTTSIPELSPREAELLAALMIKKYDYINLAEDYKLQPSQLLAFTLSPAVNAHLSALKAFADTLLALRLQETQLKSLDILEKIATSSENPIEQRRAASTILRGPCAPGGTPHRGSPRAEPSGASRRSPSSPTWGDERGAAGPAHRGGGSVSTSSTQAPLPTDEQFSRPFGSPPEEACAAEPHPSLPPEPIINTITNSLALHHRRPDPALLRFLAGSATINGQPVTPAALHDELSARIPESEVVQVQIGNESRSPGPPETFTTHIYLLHEDGPQIRINTTLTREGETHPWLLSALHIGPNTS